MSCVQKDRFRVKIHSMNMTECIVHNRHIPRSILLKRVAFTGIYLWMSMFSQVYNYLKMLPYTGRVLFTEVVTKFLPLAVNRKWTQSSCATHCFVDYSF